MSYRNPFFISLAGFGVLMTWLVAWGGKPTSAQNPAPAPGKHFLEIGKSYNFEPLGQDGNICKVLEEPRNGWIKVQDDKDGKRLWLNLAYMAVIEPTEQPIK